jgi:ubiquinone/menaquinone biosynthesis C-methylase UbiE
MSLLSNVSAAERERGRDQAGLQRRLRKLQQVFAIDSLRAERLGRGDVVTYYEQCHDAYRKYHSAEGAVHMALNGGGSFDPDGFYGQLRLLEQRWAGKPPAAVLELAFGQGFNIAHLAARHPACRFAGLDLTPAHGAIARKRVAAQGLGNVELRLGDFHALPYADASFDELYCIEAFCYASDASRALAEAARVLRPGGCLTLFDGYLPCAPGELAEPEALAVELVAKGMAIEGLQVVDELLAQATAVGLQTVVLSSLDQDVMPSLQRLERTTSAVIRWPWLGKRALARRPAARSRNVLAGYLMRTTVSLGLIGYRHIVLQKQP